MKPIDTEKIKVLIKENGIRQIDIAEIVGFTEQGFIKALKKGDLKISQLINIAKYFKISPIDLITKEFLDAPNTNKKEYINNRLNLIFKELALTISMVVDDPPLSEGCNNKKSIDYVRLSSCLDNLLKNPKPYPTHTDELNSILNETQEAYEKSRDAREKELLKYLQERIEKVMKEKEDENKL